MKIRALASGSRGLDGSTGNATPLCLSNEPKSDSTRLSLPELEFGHPPFNPFPAVVGWGRLGLFGASPTPPHTFSDQLSWLGGGYGAFRPRTMQKSRIPRTFYTVSFPVAQKL